MDSAVWIPIGALALANLVFLLLLAGLARELGVILVRLGPTTVRPTSDGPAIGDVVPAFDLRTLRGDVLAISPTKFQPKLLVFLSPRCDACERLIPGLRTLARDYAGSVVLAAVSGGEGTPEDYALAARLSPLVPYACSAEIARQFRIHATPYVVLLDAQNVVRTKGIANSLQHLESVFAVEVRQLTRASGALPEQVTSVPGRLS